MSDQSKLLDVIDQLHQEVQRLQMAQTVQQSAYLVLVHQLSVLGHMQPGALATSLETMGQTQLDEAWQSGHEAFADAVLQVAALPSVLGIKRRPRGG